MITGPQCRAARALVELSRDQLSLRSRVPVEIIAHFEQKLQQPNADVIAALREALETAGAVFIAENGGGIGVRLKFTKSETRRISTLEGEGGLVADDDVP